MQITIPALKERAEDVILLANTFLKEFAIESGKSNKPLSEKAAKMLQAYHWPGNVRELRTAIEHGVVMSNQTIIDCQHLPHFLNETADIETNTDILSPKTKNTLAESPNFNLDALEKVTITKALHHTAGNQTAAAELLGISRRTLHRKIKHITP